MADGNVMSEEDIAKLSDDDLMNLAFAPQLPEVSTEAETQEEEDSAEEESQDEADEGDDGSAGGDAEADPADDGDTADVDADSPGSEEESASDVLDRSDEDLDKPAEKPEEKKDEAPTKEELKEKAPKEEKPEEKAADAKEAETPLDYKAFYEQVMKPFTAVGKTVELRSPEEAVRLMQMGAGYTRKMAELAPHLKIVRTLEKNQLLDQDRLNFLIDLDKKNPEAIRKLLQEAKVDPLDLDIEKDSGYISKNYQVSDEEMRFSETIQEVALDQSGKELIVDVHKSWDKKSKDALWDDPEVLRVLAAQKQAGIYGKIKAEIDRRKVLGTLGAKVPFLTAYRDVGTEMDRAGLLKPEPAKTDNTGTDRAQSQETKPATEPTGGERKVVDQRTGIRKPDVGMKNDAKARAASPTKAAAPNEGVKKSDFSILSMADEEFEKSAELLQRL